MILFHVRDHCFCCAADFIVEVIPKVPLKHIPKAPTPITGLLNYGGLSVPIIDFSILMLGQPCQNKMHTRIMLLKNPASTGETKVLGLVGEEVIETREMDLTQFGEPGILLPQLPFLDGIYNTDQESIQYVQIDKLFDAFHDIYSINHGFSNEG